jgi:hypothetical protein
MSAPDYQRAPLMNISWGDIKHRPLAISCHRPGLLSDESKRHTLVEESQLPTRILSVSGIEEDPTIF